MSFSIFEPFRVGLVSDGALLFLEALDFLDQQPPLLIVGLGLALEFLGVLPPSLYLILRIV